MQNRQEPHSKATLGKEQRIYLRQTITTLFDQGSSCKGYPLRCTFVIREYSEGEHIKAMFVVPKKIHHRAVTRNLLRRRTKEAYRLCRMELEEILIQNGIAMEIALNYTASEQLEYRQIEDGIKKIFSKLGDMALSGAH